MTRPTHSTLQDFCRACLVDVKHRQKYNINTMDPQIQLWLEDCKLNSKSLPNAYPESICKGCYDKFVEILTFQKLCSRSLKTVDNILQAEVARKQRKRIEATEREYLLKNSLNVDEQMSVLDDIYGNQQWPDYNHRIRDYSRHQYPLQTLTTSNNESTIQDSIRYIKEESKLKHLSTYGNRCIKTTYSKHTAQKTTTVIKNSSPLNAANFQVIDGTNLDKTRNGPEGKIYPASLQACTKCGSKLESPKHMANSDLYKSKANSPAPSRDRIIDYKSKRSLTEHDLSHASNSHTKQTRTLSTLSNQQFVNKNCVSSARGVSDHSSSCSKNAETSLLIPRERTLKNILHKPYHCEQCGKRFIQLLALKTHLKTHENLLIKMKSLPIID